MSARVEVEVFPMSELSGSARDTALSAVAEVFGDVVVDSVSEILADYLSAHGLEGLRVDAWDAGRGFVTLRGVAVSGDWTDPGWFRDGVAVCPPPPEGDWSFVTRDRNYGRPVLYVPDEDGAPDEVLEGALYDEVADWFALLVGGAERLMRDESEYLTGEEYLAELAEINGLLFRDDGRIWL